MRWEKKSLAFYRLIIESGETEDAILRAIAQASWELAQPYREADEPLAPDWQSAVRSKRLRLLQAGITALDMDNVAGKLCNTLILRTKTSLGFQIPWFEGKRGPIEPVLNLANEVLRGNVSKDRR